MNWVRTKNGVPIVSDFASGEGTPIIIDVTTRIAYFLYNNLVLPLAPNPSAVNAFSDGFDGGFS